MRKIIVFLVLLSLILVACTGATTAEPQVEEQATEERAEEVAREPVEVEFWHALTGSFGEVLDKLISEYNASQNAVVITGVYQGNYQDIQKALLAELAAGGAPDMAQLEASFSATLVASGALRPVQDFIDDSNVGLSQDIVGAIYPGFRAVSSFDGVMYTMPFNMSMPVLYYNATMLEGAGVEQPPETWEDFIDACKAVTSGDQFGFTINPGNVWIWEAMVMQNGGQLFDEGYTEVRFNAPDAVGALDFWVDTVNQGCGKTQGWEEGRTEFFNGNVAFYKDSSGGLGGVLDSIGDFELGVTHIPWGKEKVVTIGGATFGIFANSSEEKQLAAWDFMKFLTSPESVSRLSADTGYLPTSALASEIDPLKSLLAEDALRASMLDSLPFLRPRPSVAGYAEIQSYLREAIESATLLQVSSQQALDTAAVEGQRVLDGLPAVEVVEVEFWHALTGSFGEVLDKLISEYNASQNAVVITGVYQGNYQDIQKALLAELAAGGAPDMAQLEASFSATLVASGALRPVQDFIDDSNVGLSQDIVGAIYPGFRAVSSFDGVMYTMPFNMSMPVLYYNATMLEGAGVEQPPETWEDFIDACKAVTSGDQFGFTINPGNVWIWEAMVMQNGGQLFDEGYTEVRFNAPDAVGALDFWVDTVNQGCGKTQGWEEGRTEFFNGNVAFYKDSSGGLGGVLDSIGDFELGVTHIPWGKEKVVTIGGATFGIFANSSEEKQLAAWDFMKFLTSPESVSRLSADTGYLPTSALASEIDPLKSLLAEDALRASMLDSLPFLRPRPSVAGYAEIQSYLREAIESATLLQVSSQQALDTAAVEGQRVLDEQ